MSRVALPIFHLNFLNCVYLLKYIELRQHPSLELGMMLVFSYAPYGLAEGLELSGEWLRLLQPLYIEIFCNFCTEILIWWLNHDDLVHLAFKRRIPQTRVKALDVYRVLKSFTDRRQSYDYLKLISKVSWLFSSVASSCLTTHISIYHPSLKLPCSNCFEPPHS